MKNRCVYRYSRILTKLCGALLAAVLPLGLFSACAFEDRKMYTSKLFAMDTVMELQVSGHEEVLAGAETMIRDLEKELSVTDKESAIYELNASGSAVLSDKAADILGGALSVCERTEGALDISIYPVLKAWGFTTGEYRVPEDEEIAELLGAVDYKRVKASGWNNVTYDGSVVDGTEDARGKTGGTDDGPMNGAELEEVWGKNGGTDDGPVNGAELEEVRRKSGGSDVAYTAGGASDGNHTGCRVEIPSPMQIDLGSVTKGYTGTAVADYFRQQGVTSALINLGGNVQCIGKKLDGSKWKVAIKSPFEDSQSGIYGVIEAEDTAIITSGGYERYFEEDGETYWHILDPSTGRPARNGLVSVTVIGDDGLLCDGLSTALFVMGLEKASELWRTSVDFEAVFITEEGDVYITEGVADLFTLSGEYYDAKVKVISR
jgi:thiamine biosynthesis lipoprotein